MRKIPIPNTFYILCTIFVLFVVFVVYKNIIIVKMQKYIKVNFSPREKAIHQLNNIPITDSAVYKTDNINNYYCTLNRILKNFILEMLKKNNKEFTSTELIDMVSVKDNIFYEYRNEISDLLKIYDNLKYSINSSDKDKFINVYIQTRNVIEKLNVQKSNLEIK